MQKDIRRGSSIRSVVYLDGILVGEEVNDLEGVGNNSDCKELLAVVAALHHQANLHEAFQRGTGEKESGI